MSALTAHRSLRVFYHDYVHDVNVESTAPESLPLERIAALADRLLVAADNFVGVIDANDVVLQCYLADGADRIVLELIYPEASGCLRLVLARSEALDLLAHLPAVFDETTLQGAQYIA